MLHVTACSAQYNALQYRYCAQLSTHEHDLALRSAVKSNAERLYMISSVVF
jgi:hypothetical protein